MALEVEGASERALRVAQMRSQMAREPNASVRRERGRRGDATMIDADGRSARSEGRGETRKYRRVGDGSDRRNR